MSFRTVPATGIPKFLGLNGEMETCALLHRVISKTLHHRFNRPNSRRYDNINRNYRAAIVTVCNALVCLHWQHSAHANKWLANRRGNAIRPI